MFVSETYELEDWYWYSIEEYSTPSDSGTPIDISLPSTFKLEFDIVPTSRSTTSWGSTSYLRIGTDSNNGLWIGQLTSGGRHGIMPKPNGTTQYCTNNTILNTDNHIIFTFDGETGTYICNNESVSVPISSIPKIISVTPTHNNPLKNIKVTRL